MDPPAGDSKLAIEQRLERKLQLRPTAGELIEKNVLKAGDVAPALRAMQAEFERAKVEDSLNRKLANRPTRERLIGLNLMKDDTVSPEMRRRQHEVEKSFMETRLNRKLANRPTREALAEKNLLKAGDPEMLANREAVQRKLIEASLNSKLSAKYSTRWSAGKGNEAAPLLTSWDRKRDKAPYAEAGQGDTTAALSAVSEAPNAMEDHVLRSIGRKISSFSLLQKSNFIQQLQQEGRFVCVNCCSEDFQGPELSSPRYSWDDFYNEEEWAQLGLQRPRHSEEARKLGLCNMCFGLCACGFKIGIEGTCTNCGSLRPISGQEQWRAPEHRRPRTAEEVEGRRAAQLQNFHLNEHKTAMEIIKNGQHTRKISFKPNVRVRYFQRFRFRNSFNDDCYLLSVPPPGGPVPEGFVPELYVEDAEQAVAVANEQEGLMFFEPDGDGNVFVVAPFEFNDDADDASPWRQDEDTEETGNDLVGDDEDEDDEDEDDEDDNHSETEETGDGNREQEHDQPQPPAAPIKDESDSSEGHGRSDDEDRDSSRASSRRSSNASATIKKATALNSTRVFLYDPNKDLFYYADKSHGEIFCWNPLMGVIHRV